ncbi:MAG: hypothetical protein Q7S22_06335 [Candidatus Micrarchaeota archaeon]|nr:hypothetical protein [Candidatus Micrarchaeota archaeon]
MALTPAQQLRKEQLLVKKELGDLGKWVAARIKFPVFVEGMAYTLRSKTKPPELANETDVQQIRVMLLSNSSRRTRASPDILDIFYAHQTPPSMELPVAGLSYANPGSVIESLDAYVTSSILGVDLVKFEISRTGKVSFMLRFLSDFSDTSLPFMYVLQMRLELSKVVFQIGAETKYFDLTAVNDALVACEPGGM